MAVTESAANTFTRTTEAVPLAPVILTGGSGRVKVLAMEVMKVKFTGDQPSLEAGQNNLLRYGLFTSGNGLTSIEGYNNPHCFWVHKVFILDLQTAAGATDSTYIGSLIDDLTDGDGNGELIVSNDIDFIIQGTGNASARSGEVDIKYHLVELEGDEAAVHQAVSETQ